MCGKKYQKLYTLPSYVGVVYLLYILRCLVYIVVSCLVFIFVVALCIVVILSVFAVLCVYCYFYFRCRRTAG
jgi:hypothetical protein